LLAWDAIDNAVVPLPLSVGVGLGSPAIDQPDNTVIPLPLNVGVAPASPTIGQAVPAIIIDHTSVAKYADIPQRYIDIVKTKRLTNIGESHSHAIPVGLSLLAAQDTRFPASVILDAGVPEAATTEHLRADRLGWGDVDHPTGFRYSHGEEDFFTSAAAIAQIKAFLTYCGVTGPALDYLMFGWCWDMTWVNRLADVPYDPVYGCRWCGSTVGGPQGNLRWGLDAEDQALTGNSVCLDSYLAAIEEYIAHCAADGIGTKVCYTTGPVDGYLGEEAYQRHLKQERIRTRVSTVGGLLYDFADILAWDDAGTENIQVWNGHSYQMIAADNLLQFDGSDGSEATTYHFGERGALRLAKAVWVALAMDAGWDGEPEVNNLVEPLPLSIGITPESPAINQVDNAIIPIPVSVGIVPVSPVILQVDNSVIPLSFSVGIAPESVSVNQVDNSVVTMDMFIGINPGRPNVQSGPLPGLARIRLTSKTFRVSITAKAPTTEGS